MKFVTFVRPSSHPLSGLAKSCRTVPIALVTLATLATSPAVLAQGTGAEAGKAKAPDQKANPLGGIGLKVDAGYRYLGKGNRDTTYYRIDFQGATLASRGDSFTDAEGFTAFKPIREDEPALRFTLERGPTDIEGTLANFLERTKFSGVRNLRGVVQGYGALDGSSAPGFSLGLESLPISATIPDVPNFLTLGVQLGTNQVATGTGTERNTRQSDVGVFAYRQFIAYAPLNQYSDLREKARAVADGLPKDNPVVIPDFYAKVIAGDASWFDALSGLFENTPEGRKAQAALEGLTDDQKKEITGDLHVTVPFLASDLKGLPLETADTVRERLIRTGATEPEKAFGTHFDTLAAIPPAIANWRTVPADTRRVLTRFIVSGGLVLNSAETVEQAKQYVRDGMKIAQPAQSLSDIDAVITLAYKQGKASDKKALLAAANRIILQTQVPEVANYGVQVNGLKPVLLRLYNFKDRSSSVLLVENTGQYYFAGDDGNNDNSRLNHLVAATMTFYVNPGADKRNFLRLRYENGRNRATPEVYLNQAMATVGIEF